MLEEEHPWTKGEMNRIGEALRGDRALDEEKYAEIILWHDELLAEVYLVSLPILDKYVSDDSPRMNPQNIGRDPIYSSRIKNDGTIVEKLSRLKTKLSRVQDFAGARFDIDCGPVAQEAIAEDLKRAFEKFGATVVLKKYLEKSQQGYRAIHLHITGKAGRIELQIRSHIQSRWANTYEALADVTGREIRYEDDPAISVEPLRRLVSSMKGLSESIYEWECSLDGAQLKFAQAIEIAQFDDGIVQSIRETALNFSESAEVNRQELISSMESITGTLQKLKGSSS